MSVDTLGVSRRGCRQLNIDSHKLAGRASNFEWNGVGETASAAAAGNLFHSGMVRARNHQWSCAVTAPMARTEDDGLLLCCHLPRPFLVLCTRRRVVMG